MTTSPSPPDADRAAPRPDDVAGLFMAHRMLSDGIPWHDFERGQAEIARVEDWFPFWMARADRYEALGRDALAAGRSLSGGRWLWHASLSAHYAQAMWVFEPELREAGQRRKVELYAQAAPFLDPPAIRIEIPFRGAVIPAYLRAPAGPAPERGFPCAVLIGGGESTKEESLLFENLLLDRGVATMAFDGPGQGEVWFHTKVEHAFEAWTSRVVDRLLEGDLGVDPDRLGVLGRSLGGHYALRSLARDPRLRAGVAWGANVNARHFRRQPPLTMLGNLYIAGYPWDRRAEGLDYLETVFDLSDVAGQIRQPTLILQGGQDVFWGPEHVEGLRAAFPGPNVSIVVEPAGTHCCHNLTAEIRPRLADWLAGQLTTAG